MNHELRLRNSTYLKDTSQHHLAHKDEQCRCYNRRAFDYLHEGELIALFDVDSMKYVNDVLGREVGDALLKDVAGTIGEHYAAVFRVEGGRFAVFLDGVLADILTQKNVRFTYGIGRSLEVAEIDLRRAKQIRERSGHRAPPGRRPPWIERYM